MRECRCRHPQGKEAWETWKESPWGGGSWVCCPPFLCYALLPRLPDRTALRQFLPRHRCSRITSAPLFIALFSSAQEHVLIQKNKLKRKKISLLTLSFSPFKSLPFHFPLRANFWKELSVLPISRSLSPVLSLFWIFVCKLNGFHKGAASCDQHSDEEIKCGQHLGSPLQALCNHYPCPPSQISPPSWLSTLFGLVANLIYQNHAFAYRFFPQHHVCGFYLYCWCTYIYLLSYSYNPLYEYTNIHLSILLMELRVTTQHLVFSASPALQILGLQLP